MKAVVFDLDGVLIDSLPNMKMAWGIVQLHHKIDIPFSEYEKQIGKPFFDILTAIGITENHREIKNTYNEACLLYTSPSPRDQRGSRMPSSA